MTETNDLGNQGHLNSFNEMNKFDQTHSTITNVFVVNAPARHRSRSEHPHPRRLAPAVNYIHESGLEYMYPALLSATITGVVSAAGFAAKGDSYDKAGYAIWLGVSFASGFCGNFFTALGINKKSVLALGASAVMGVAAGAGAIYGGLQVEAHRGTSYVDGPSTHDRMEAEARMKATADSLTRAREAEAKTIHLHDAHKLVGQKHKSHRAPVTQ